ncbi:hypothetical protein [Bacillus altitudinis]|uniref:hypothetical protein n=1 Tax=Bacillus altitudinis TaxID=293387 RepID=UPI0011A50846|nr:hypothetical protein [Bacillus altitudinis]
MITNRSLIETRYKNGDVLKVTRYYDLGVFSEEDHGIWHTEYEVIVGEHTPIPNLDEMDYDELVALVEDVMKALRTRSYKNGYDQGRFDAEIEAPKSDQQKRDEVVEKAKEDVRVLYYKDYVGATDFIVNAEKRTVVSIRKAFGNGRVISKGIAKCAPNDCFNAHIGKAIALRRALGLEVPSEYLNVPQPTEVRVGDVVRGRTSFSMDTYEETVRKSDGGKYEYASGGYDYTEDADLVIIDDSRAGDGE